MRLPYRCAWLVLMLAGCPGNGNEDDTSTSFGTPTGSGSDGTATSSVDPETGSSGDVDETSTGGTGCTAGLPGCTCLPDDTCMGDAVCEAGICQDVSDDTTAGEDTGTTDGPDPVCGNGMPEPGLLCFGTSVPQAMGAGTIGITIGVSRSTETPYCLKLHRVGSWASYQTKGTAEGGGGIYIHVCNEPRTDYKMELTG